MYTRLEKRNPAQKQMRYYCLTITPDLFGEWALISEWGWIGRSSGGRIKTEWFATQAEALSASLIRERWKKQHGYQMIPQQLELF